MKKLLVTLVATLFVSLIAVGCTVTITNPGKWAKYGSSAEVRCYSGGVEVFKAKTAGKPENIISGGWEFVTTDGVYVQTFADCFVSAKSDVKE